MSLRDFQFDTERKALPYRIWGVGVGWVYKTEMLSIQKVTNVYHMYKWIFRIS